MHCVLTVARKLRTVILSSVAVASGRSSAFLSPVEEFKQRMGKKTDCFRSIVLGGINAMVVLSSAAIITLLLIPVKFENNLWYNPNGQAPPNDSLALAMTMVQWRNYFSNVPDVHLNVSNDQMTDLWFLPRGTRLSPLMQSIARCRMAVDVKRVDDPDMCNRVTVGWPWAAMIVAMINLVDIVLGGHMKRVVKNGDAKTMKLLNHSFFHNGTWLVFYGVIRCFIIANRDIHIGMLYTLPYEIYPQPYCRAYPTIWIYVLLLCFANYILKLIELLICACK